MTRDITFPSLTPEQIEFVEYYTSPAHEDIIHKHLLGLAMVKHLKGDDMQREYILSRHIDLLEGVTELDLMDYIEWYELNDETGFFPEVSYFIKKMGVKRNVGKRRKEHHPHKDNSKNYF